MSGSQLGAYLPLVLIVVIAYLVLIRPARRRALAVQHLQAALSPGDEVLLTSGFFATVVEVADETASVELAPGTVVRVHRRAVGQIVTDLPALPTGPRYDDAALDDAALGDSVTNDATPDDAAPEAGRRSGDENPGVN